MCAFIINEPLITVCLATPIVYCTDSQVSLYLTDY